MPDEITAEDKPASIFDGMQYLTTREPDDRLPYDPLSRVRACGRTYEQLRGEVESGRFTPEEVEHALELERRAPLMMIPKFEEIPYWSLEMVAAWVRERTLEAVGRHDKATWPKARVWIRNGNVFDLKTKETSVLPRDRVQPFDTQLGYDLIELDEPRLGHPYYSFKGVLTNFPADTDWFERVRPHLVGGNIRAIGVENKGVTVNFHAAAFLEAELIETQDGKWQLRANGRNYVAQFNSLDVIRETTAHGPGVAREHRILPWKEQIDPALTATELLFDYWFKKYYPAGFPLYNSHAQRYFALMVLLQLHGRKEWVENQASFDRFLLRYLPKVCNL